MYVHHVTTNNERDEGMTEDDVRSVAFIRPELHGLTVDDLFDGIGSHRRCVVCLEYMDNGLAKLPELGRQHLIFFHRFWCSPESRLSPSHLIGSGLHPDTVVDVKRSGASDHHNNAQQHVIARFIHVSRLWRTPPELPTDIQHTPNNTPNGLIHVEDTS